MARRTPSLHAPHLVAVALLATASALAACSTDAPPAGPAAPPAVQAEPAASGDVAKSPAPPREKVKLAETRFGQPISPGATTTLASIVAEPAKFSGKSVKTEGVVKAVCQSAGCWMEIEPDGGAPARAHVKMAGHSFYVPKNCDGHRAVIEGTVQGAPEDTCGAKDSCGGSENGALAKLEIAATGVEFVD